MKKAVAKTPMSKSRPYCCVNCGEDFKEGQKLFPITNATYENRKSIESYITSCCSENCRNQSIKESTFDELDKLEHWFYEDKKELALTLQDIPITDENSHIIMFGKLRLKILNNKLLMTKCMRKKDASYYRFKKLLQENLEEMIAISPNDSVRMNTSETSMVYLHCFNVLEVYFTI